jgi:hypothetical protein
MPTVDCTPFLGCLVSVAATQMELVIPRWTAVMLLAAAVVLSSSAYARVLESDCGDAGGPVRPLGGLTAVTLNNSYEILKLTRCGAPTFIISTAVDGNFTVYMTASTFTTLSISSGNGATIRIVFNNVSVSSLKLTPNTRSSMQIDASIVFAASIVLTAAKQSAFNISGDRLRTSDLTVSATAANASVIMGLNATKGKATLEGTSMFVVDSFMAISLRMSNNATITWLRCDVGLLGVGEIANKNDAGYLWYCFATLNDATIAFIDSSIRDINFAAECRDANKIVRPFKPYRAGRCTFRLVNTSYGPGAGSSANECLLSLDAPALNVTTISAAEVSSPTSQILWTPPSRLGTCTVNMIRGATFIVASMASAVSIATVTNTSLPPLWRRWP